MLSQALLQKMKRHAMAVTLSGSTLLFPGLNAEVAATATSQEESDTSDSSRLSAEDVVALRENLAICLDYGNARSQEAWNALTALRQRLAPWLREEASKADEKSRYRILRLAHSIDPNYHDCRKCGMG